jgi:hypothetical protein
MSKELKKDWLPKLQARYLRRHREGKSRMLDELCDDYQYERKYAIKLLSGSLAAAAGKVHPGPERRYGEIQPVVHYIWLGRWRTQGSTVRRSTAPAASRRPARTPSGFCGCCSALASPSPARLRQEHPPTFD